MENKKNEQENLGVIESFILFRKFKHWKLLVLPSIVTIIYVFYNYDVQSRSGFLYYLVLLLALICILGIFEVINLATRKVNKSNWAVVIFLILGISIFGFMIINSLTLEK